MSLKLQMLGTGSAFAKKYYNNNALLLDDDFTLLIDCGSTAPLALHEMGRSFNDIDAVLITHIHADHVGGLEELAFMMKMKFKRRIPLYIGEALAAPLWDHTLRGGLYQQGEISCLEDIFDVRPLKPGVKVDISKGITVELIQTRHIPGKDSYSLYLNDRIFYSADMVFDPELLNKLVNERGCELILHECQLQGPGEVHTTLQELLSLPEHIQQRTYLMHYSDDVQDFVGKTGEMEFVEQQKIYEL
ncbi:MBL fold metallo-hydrolase [Paenibacillus campinasensis]|uniref:MBL fold metallo-hydrolase n=1 Tax=Paenibacillus campinasensis TaxID=66347 RepID=A0ABW9T0A1_9BACL|nr:MBL fold metallo-hydrolase [Paenibacillus campinasensis]MUG64731.1 MBL fold metallo-hydrolase [Paenibacillus campinasensis]